MTVKRTQGIDTAEFNYAPYAQQMKDDGIQFVQYFGPYQFAKRLQEAIEQQNVDIKVFFQDPTLYDAKYTEQAGSAGDGSYVYITHELFDDLSVPEMKLYRQWLEAVAPGSEPNYFGLYAWSATRLFVQKATELGGQLSRQSLVSAVGKVSNWDSNGMHTPMDVGANRTSPCVKIAQLKNGTWGQFSKGGYLCGKLIDTGIGG